jgi:putative intracellular protease/amidase
MKRFLIIVAILLSMVVSGVFAHAEPGPKVLMIPREGYSADIKLMLAKEVGVMKRMLFFARFKVEVATASGMTIVSPALDLKPDLRLADVKVADYVGFIMPCMAVGGIPGPPVAPEAVAIVKQAVAEGKPVAAQFGSVMILAQAGILKGKKYALLSDPLKPAPWRKITDPRFDGAIYSGRNVVQDGNIITSGVCPYLERVTGLPDQTTKLTQAFIAELKKK